jgi:pyrroloquinoline quinone (PQQ) biosynthesis protein C
VNSAKAEKFITTFDFLVKSFPGLLAAGAARMEDEETRGVLAVNLFQECGEGDIRRTHYAIYKKFSETAGVQSSAIQEPNFTFEWRTDLLKYIQGASSAQAALGALASGEFLAQPVLGRIFPVLRPLYPGADTEYFTKHLDLETRHVEELTDLLVRRFREDSEWREVLAGFQFGLSVWETYFNRLTDFIGDKEDYSNAGSGWTRRQPSFTISET